MFGSCVGKYLLNNIADAFKLYCNGYGSCYGANVDINIGGNSNPMMPSVPVRALTVII